MKIVNRKIREINKKLKQMQETYDDYGNDIIGFSAHSNIKAMDAIKIEWVKLAKKKRLYQFLNKLLTLIH